MNMLYGLNVYLSVGTLNVVGRRKAAKRSIREKNARTKSQLFGRDFTNVRWRRFET